MVIGKRIVELRKELNLSQEQLAERANISQTHISKIELGRDNPSFKLLKKIADALDCQLYIDLIPNGQSITPPEPTLIEPDYQEERPAIPTWVTLEQASAITIFTIALEKLRLEKSSLTPAEMKVLDGLVEMYKDEIEPK